MTNIQAIDLLKDLEQSLDDYCELNDEGKTAFRMAITALELFGISEQLPSAQPEVAKDINVPNTDTISRQGAIDGLSGHYVERRNLNDWQMGWNNALEWVEDVYLKDLPSVQPKPHYDEWCDDCKEYDKERHCCPRWNRVIRQTLKDAQPEQRWIPCGKCIHADGKHRRCKILDRSINEDYFCCWAEPFREEGDK